MRKSEGIRLVLLGGASLAIASCDETPPPDARFFTSTEECATVHSQATCEEALADSQSRFTAEAPRYLEGGLRGGIWWRQLRASRGWRRQLLHADVDGLHAGQCLRQPVYRGPGNGAMMRTGGRFYNVGTFAGTGRAASFQPARISPVRRGGFGATASSYRTSSGG